MSTPGPAAVYSEDLPDYPVPAAADPYTNSQSQSQQVFHGAAHFTRPGTRPLSRMGPGHNSIIAGGANVTGINSWWGFTSGSVSGLGRYLVNVGTGNLVLQAGDMNVPHRGAALTFMRTYNSNSQHDWNNSDQGGVNNYGDGWTNTFDMHIAKNSLSGGSGISVFDDNGARYDYEKDCTPSCVFNINSPLGQHSILTYDNSTGWYYWTTKSGTVFLFHNLSDNTGVAGRLAKVWFRNNNVRLIFTYSFDSGASPAPATLSSITVATDTTNGHNQTAQLTFSNFSTSSGTRRLLSTLTEPDGSTTVNYKYDTSGRLVEVDEPTNNTTNSSLPQLYQYSSSGYLLTEANGPRWSLSTASPPPSALQGGFTDFVYAGNSVTAVQSYGYINPTVTDDSGTGAIQAPGGVSGSYGVTSAYRQTYFSYSNVSPAPSPAPSQSPTGIAACSASGSTAVYGTDGREVVACWDSANRIVQSSQWTGSIWLTSFATWDSNNNLVSTKDQRSNETDMAYDALGNLIAEALPAASPGATRPTSLFTYDASNNLVAECDPIWADANGFDWSVTPPPSSSCPASHANSPTNPGPTLATFAPSSPEPFGELAAITKPLGYQVKTSYSPGPQAGTIDFGQPTEIIAASPIPQADGTSVTPATDLYYDDYGNLICTVTHAGTDTSPTLNTAINVYSTSSPNDAVMGRVTQSADADDSSLSNSNQNGACPKTAGIPGSSIVRSFTYFANGQVATSQSPEERAATVSTGFTYDADGDLSTETKHYGSLGSPAPTTRFYDADGRLVEVVKPGSWDTRYDYDLTQGMTTNTGSAVLVGVSGTVAAHGALLKIQEFHSPNWIDMSGSAYDSAGRVIDKYTYMPNHNCTLSNLTTCENANAAVNVYDGTGEAGLLSTSTDAGGVTTTLAYDNAGRITSTSLSDGTHGSGIGYDLDGRVTTLSDTCVTGCSPAPESYTYDRDSNMITKVEMSRYNSDPTKLSYTYYPNGSREYVSAVPAPSSSPQSGSMNQSNLLTYNYDASGQPRSQTLAYGAASPMPFGFSQTRGGRPTGETDPYPSASTTIAYDASGRLNQLVDPEGTTYFNSFDPEGELLTFTEPGQTSAVVQNFDGNGVMIKQIPPGSDPNTGCTFGFTQTDNDGFMNMTTNTPDLGGGCSNKTTTGADDVRNAVQSTTWVSSQNPIGRVLKNYTFDSDGRVSIGWKDNGGSAQSFTNVYDGDGHLVQRNVGANVAMERNYGPDGQIDQIGTADASHVIHYETLHWDGHVLLFTTNSSGQVDDVKVGQTADYFPLDSSNAQLTVWDRDNTGRIRACHNNGGNSGSWSKLDGYNFTTSPLPPLGGCTTPAMYGGAGVGQGSAVLQPDGDGYWDGFVMIQGVRDYDTQLRAWEEPDPLPGRAWNPSSQKRYAWDGNNPSSYQDLSGMAPISDNATYDPSSGWFDWNPGFYGGGYTANGMPMDFALGPLANVNPAINAMNGWAQVWSKSFGWGTDSKGRPALVLHEHFLGWAFSATLGAAVIYRAVNQQELQSIQELGRYSLGPGQEGKPFFPTEEQAQSFANRMGSDDDPYTVTSTEVDDDYANQPGVEAFEPATEGPAYFFRGDAVPGGPVTIGPNGGGGGGDPYLSEGSQ